MVTQTTTAHETSLSRTPAQYRLPEPRPLTVSDLTRREFLIGAGGLLVFAPYGCGSDEQGGSGSSGETRSVEHALGTTEVPMNPQRVVVLDANTVDTVFALGVRSVGGPDPDSPAVLSHLKERLKEVESWGQEGQPDLETIATMEPDLILGIETQLEEIYNEASQIAPTVAAERQSYLYDKGSFAGTVLEDVGLLRPESQRGDETFVEVSLERLDLAEGDVMFVWTSSGEEDRVALSKLKEELLWSRLKVVQGGEVYEVGDYWSGSGPIAANLVLDDLFEHLAEGESG